MGGRESAKAATLPLHRSCTAPAASIAVYCTAHCSTQFTAPAASFAVYCTASVLYLLHCTGAALLPLLLLQFIALRLYCTCCTAPELHCPRCSYRSLLHYHSTVLFALHSALLLLQFSALPLYCTSPIAVYCTVTLLCFSHCTVHCLWV